jgi:hypothetical protein
VRKKEAPDNAVRSVKRYVKEQQVNAMIHHAKILTWMRKFLSSSLPLFLGRPSLLRLPRGGWKIVNRED